MGAAEDTTQGGVDVDAVPRQASLDVLRQVLTLKVRSTAGERKELTASDALWPGSQLCCREIQCGGLEANCLPLLLPRSYLCSPCVGVPLRRYRCLPRSAEGAQGPEPSRES